MLFNVKFWGAIPAEIRAGMPVLASCGPCHKNKCMRKTNAGLHFRQSTVTSGLIIEKTRISRIFISKVGKTFIIWRNSFRTGWRGKRRIR